MRPMVAANGEVPPEYLVPGLDILRKGGDVLDAVEEIARRVEADPSYRSVGVGGLPNICGEVELDALIMDGDTRRAGAVAGVRRFPHPISVARAVLSDLPHVLLIGDGAERFAREKGFREAPLLTEESRARWQEKLRELGAPSGAGRALSPLVRQAMRAHVQGDTMNAIACDRNGRMAVAVSTSGLAWKHPGRVGDSPVPGAGGYADSRYGVAAATGVGELMLRSGSSLRAVMYRAAGATAAEAARRALTELRELEGSAGARVRLIVVTPSGEIAGAATWPEAEIAAFAEGDRAPRTLPCEVVI